MEVSVMGFHLWAQSAIYPWELAFEGNSACSVLGIWTNLFIKQYRSCRNSQYWPTRNDSVQFSSVAQSCPTLWDPMVFATAACQASLSITNSWSLPKLVSIESVMPSNHLILCHPFFSHLQSFPASGSFPMSWFFTSGSQNIGVSASTSVLPMNTKDWSPLGWTGCIFCSPKDSQESSPTPWTCNKGDKK